IALKGVRVTFLRVGKRHGDLKGQAAGTALHAGDPEQDVRRLGSDGHTAEDARHMAVGDDVPGRTDRALQGRTPLLDGEQDLPFKVVGTDVAVAADPKGMVE